MKKFIPIFLISVLILIPGCLETQREVVNVYVCPDGSLASNADDCPKAEPEVVEVMKYVCFDGVVVDNVADCPTTTVSVTSTIATTSIIDALETTTLEELGTTSTVEESTTTTSSTTTTTTIESTTIDIRISAVQFDAPGAESENLNGEWVEVSNSGVEVDMTRWTLQDEQEHIYTFPSGFEIETGGSVKIHTGEGTDTSSDLYWNLGRGVWNNNGDTAILKDQDGEIVDEMNG
ncbi:MAG: lamin tail domain-containing protein [Candidatus Altiarchaeales archaeon]|nr:lamin tail domain-containing protein [Candidatus Altiarchaeota archaeon]MCG2782377.1 lamin tail domain-containing protein [Candidatus Altiarchaeales archaeon]